MDNEIIQIINNTNVDNTKFKSFFTLKSTSPITSHHFGLVYSTGEFQAFTIVIAMYPFFSESALKFLYSNHMIFASFPISVNGTFACAENTA